MKTSKKNINDSEFENYMYAIIESIKNHDEYKSSIENKEERKLIYPLLLEKLLSCEFKNKILKSLRDTKNRLDFEYHKFYFHTRSKYKYRCKRSKINYINFYIIIRPGCPVFLGFVYYLDNVNYKRCLYVNCDTKREDLIKLINLQSL